MSYKQVKNLKATEFKRLCGVTPEIFLEMVKVIAAEKVLAKKSGRPSKLSVEDQLLMTLEYWRLGGSPAQWCTVPIFIWVQIGV